MLSGYVEDRSKMIGDGLAQLSKGGALMNCRTCKGDHWTARCLYKDESSAPETPDKEMPKPTRDVYARPRFKRDGAENSVRVTNLSEDTREPDLLELFGTFGPVNRVHVAKDQNTGESRGAGFVNFADVGDAQKAIKKLNGYGYDNLILGVDWATPRAAAA